MALTHEIYTDRIKIVLKEGEYAVIAEENIKCGTLILLEHVLVGTREFLSYAIAGNRILFDELCPRQWNVEKWGEKDMNGYTWNGKNFDQLLNEGDIYNMQYNAELKAHYNMFTFSEDKVIIGRTISKFNHGCWSNCLVTKLDNIMLEDKTIVDSYGVYTTANVAKGEELLIDYSYGSIRSHNKIREEIGSDCNCDDEKLNLIAKRTIASARVIVKCMDRDYYFIIHLVNNYIQTDTAKKVVMNQMLAREEIHNFGPYNIITSREDKNLKNICRIYAQIKKKINKMWK